MSGTITHKWEGTTLVVTSDSGTSSCDLKGDKGDIGVRGAQGAAGVVTGSTVLGKGQPTADSAGGVGVFYLDTETNKLYFCATAGIWQEVSANEKNYELIETITIADDSTIAVERNTEPNGAAYNFKKIYVDIRTPQAAANTAGLVAFSDQACTYFSNMLRDGANGVITKVFGEIQNGMLTSKGVSSNNGEYGLAWDNPVLYHRGFGGLFKDSITSVRVAIANNARPFPADTVITIYGVRF